MKINLNECEIKNYQVFLIISLALVGSFYIYGISDNLTMGNYDLYQCIYNNANDNGFTQNQIMINKIQDECICFRNNNYSNLIDANCSRGD